MSGLVNGLQNRLRRFESARHLIKATNNVGCFFVILSRQLSSTFLYSTFFPSGYPQLYGILKFCSILSLLSPPHNPRRKPIDHPRHNSREHPRQAESKKEQQHVAVKRRQNTRHKQRDAATNEIEHQTVATCPAQQCQHLNVRQHLTNTHNQQA